MKIISDNPSLEELCQNLSQQSFITVDLEFIREKTYFPILCLIQIASEKQTAIIDPLADGINLQSFFNLMKNPKVIKVFHSCRQDVEIIYELSGIIPQPLFDTQVAAMVCGFGESISYERLVKAILNINLDKTNRLSNLLLRPLDKQQLEYAAGDVTHLLKIYRYLNEHMMQKGRTEWIKEEMDMLNNKNTYVTPPEEAWLKIRSRSHNIKTLSALKALACWRENKARDKNVPRQSIIKDDCLLMIATNCPKNKNELSKIRGIHKDFVSSKLADEILDILSKMVIDPNIAKELHYEDTNTIPPLYELLKMLLKIIAQKEGVVARLIASDLELQKLAAGDKNHQILTGWRQEIFGNLALKLCQGDLNIHYNPQKKEIEFTII